MILFTYDDSGFPMARLTGVGAFHLWPVTKFQFYRFVSQSGAYNEKWYDSLCALNPEVTLNDLCKDNYERLFMTGLHVREALDFASWLGDGYDIPTVEEWTKFYKAVESEHFLFKLSPYALCDTAVSLDYKLREFFHTPLTYTGLNPGVVEWVRGDHGYEGRGVPRDQFFPNLWCPPDDAIKVIDMNERIFYFGIRLIKRSTL